MKFTDEQIESLILSIYNGSVDAYNLPVDLYMAVGNYLEKGLFKGFGGELVDFSGSKLELLQSLRENVWLFSGAKTFQTVSAMEAMLSDNGEMRTFKEFKEFAREKYDLYNDTWAKTEYQTAIGQGQNAERWAQIEADKDVFPKLRYSAVIDANTSEICAPLNGLVFNVDDPEVDIISPENHFNCRCLWEQVEEDVPLSENRKEVSSSVADEMNDAFKNNVGKTGEVFGADHPYFTDIPKEDRDYAQRNFDLEIPE